MAILQCQDFLEPLRRRGVKVSESIDTALSAKWISEDGKKGVAALASDLAAEMYGLEVIAGSVESNKRNFTRFLIAEPVNTAEIDHVKVITPKTKLRFILHFLTG
jgi:prephenate dehydratase